MDPQGVGMSTDARIDTGEPILQARGLIKRHGRVTGVADGLWRVSGP